MGHLRATALAAVMWLAPVSAQAQPTGQPAITLAQSAALAVEAHYAAYRLKPGEAAPEGARLAMGALLDAALRQASPPDGTLDHDPFCACQDYDETSFRVEIVQTIPVGTAVSVRVKVTPVPGTEPIPLNLLLQQVQGSWHVLDIFDSTGASLRLSALRAVPGSWAQQ
jgi:hypothetical protein